MPRSAVPIARDRRWGAVDADDRDGAVGRRARIDGSRRHSGRARPDQAGRGRREVVIAEATVKDR